MRDKLLRINGRSELKKARDALAGRVAFVPTMGALHEGHLALVKRASELADAVVVSIFVNPTQFAPHEDFDSYPRDVEADCAKLEALGVAAVYLPSVADVYGERAEAVPFDGQVAKGLESDRRPHFFDGVTSVVRRLFEQVQPDVAVFGEKDYQQLCVIAEMAAREALGVEVVGVPTMRESDGLAMSSRNRYLSEAERQVAPTLHAVITEVAARFARGERPETCKAWAFEELLELGFTEVDYIAIRHAETLAPVSFANEPARVLAAVWLGKTRLIDNVPVLMTAQ